MIEKTLVQEICELEQKIEKLQERRNSVADDSERNILGMQIEFEKRELEELRKQLPALSEGDM